MNRGEEIVLDASEPLKLHYLEPWQMSSKYLKKIKMHFLFGVLFNLHKDIWLSLSVYTAWGPLSAFHGAVTAAEWATLSFCTTSSSRGQVTNPLAWARLPWSLMSHPAESHRRGSELPHMLYLMTWHHNFLKWDQKLLSRHSLKKQQPPKPITAANLHIYPRNFKGIAIWCKFCYP